MAVSKEDQAALKYSGLMGHPYNVVIDCDPIYNSNCRTVCAEVNDLDQATVVAQKNAGKNPIIYGQTGKRGKARWRGPVV